MRSYFLLLVGTALLAGCSRTVYPDSLVQPLPNEQQFQKTIETTLEIPEGLKIVSVDYDAELYSISSEGSTYDEGEHGRGFVKVYAVDQSRGDQYLLIYES